MNLNNKILAIIFFALLGIWLLKNVVSSPSTRSFKSVLMAVDTSSVDKMVLYPKGVDSSSFELIRNGAQWRVKNENVDAPAENERINAMLGLVYNIPTQQLISKSVERQKDYEVDDASGKILEVYSGGQLIDKIVFGRFNFNPTTRSATSYARLDGENDIYSIDGMMSLSLATDVNQFRNGTLSSLSESDIKQLILNGNNVVKDENGQWSYNGSILDSLKMQNYLQGLSQLNSSDFADNFSATSAPVDHLEVVADNQTQAIVLDAFANGNGFVLKSSENNAFFASDSTGIYERAFSRLKEMLIAQ